ncbi:hypothetical protein AVEN_208826-1 [Araneus ventricosus]|uniref:Protein YIPF n=1 Tax=Araneus ventricosus TaxID=182803 RepID=A0A4Y2TGA0_ARAVE|nr:hypothetical protein AVEN_208826-1 [Araneus ventricosus]
MIWSDAQSELQFQDFTLGATSPDVATLVLSGSYSNYKESLDSPGDENEDLLGTEKKEGRATFLDRQIVPKPDLYGPFWIAATLVFSTAICANIANYLTTEGRSAHNWSYDFHKGRQCKHLFMVS